jgi:TadE-like protein
MHRPIPPPQRASAGRTVRRRGSAGQSLVEFALVIPILLVLFIAIADFGRVFVAGVALEAATRDAAEAAANQYIAAPPGPLESPAPAFPAPAFDATYYGKLHAYAASVVCAEMRDLPSTNYDPGPPPTCPDMPIVMVCVHDGADTSCSSEASAGGIPSNCNGFTPRPNSSQTTNPDGTQSRWVEVRTCYHFTALLNLPFFSLGDFWLQRTRNFTIPCWFVLAGAECG